MRSVLIIIIILCCFKGHTQKKTVEKIGDITQLALPLTAGLSTLILKDNKGMNQFLKSYATTIALTYILKYTINKPRPENNGNYSFPSGHTASAFSGASFIQRRYGWKYGVPAYALAVFTGFSRIEAKKHDGYDVLAGSIIGIGSTYLFTTPYLKKHLELSSNKIDNTFLISIKYKF
jgi:membrane-associated phospholipid phosphatase